MTDATSQEKLLALHIKLLRRLGQLEKAKQEALLKPEIEKAFALQDECNALFKKIETVGVNLERAMQQTAKHGPTVLQRERREKLLELRKAAAEEADRINRENQALFERIMAEVKKEIAHLRAGRKALAGYGGRGLKPRKPPAIISGKF